MKKLMIYMIPIVCMLLSVTQALAQTKLASISINSGGVTQSSTNYRATLTIGQPVAGTSSSTSYKAMLGFWHSSGVLVDVEDETVTELPRKYLLSQNYPNPFNPSTTIEFSLPKRSDVKIEVFNILGQPVRSLSDQTMSAGEHKVTWDGRGFDNKPVASGIYFYRISTDEYNLTKKMILLK